MNEFTDKHQSVLRNEGILITVLGLLAILLPGVFTLGIGILLGAVFLVAGALKLYRALRFRDLPGFGWSLTGALLLTAVGISFLIYPWDSIAVLTLILVALFLMEGIGEIGYALQNRDVPIWGLAALSGVASLIIALLLFFHWPSSAAWAIGLLVGINLLFTGTWLLAMSSALKRIAAS